jgi:hypothetical protein
VHVIIINNIDLKCPLKTLPTNPQTTATVLFRPFRRFRRSFRSSSYQLRPTSFPSPRFSFPLLHLVMHLQSQSSVPGFSWQDDSSRLASPFPLGSKCLGLRGQRLPQSHQRVRGWWCSWPGLGSVHGPSQALSSTAAEVLTRYIPHSLLMLSACRSVFRFASSMQSKPAWCRPWHRHYRFTLCVRSYFFFPSFPFSFPSSILWKRA